MHLGVDTESLVPGVEERQNDFDEEARILSVQSAKRSEPECEEPYLNPVHHVGFDRMRP